MATLETSQEANCDRQTGRQKWGPSYHNTLVDLIFVSTVNIPNLSLLPYREVA